MGNSKEAQDWMNMYLKAMEAGKLTPAKLTNSDLGGMDSFGELARMVEQAQDIVPILPKFKEKPQDKPDFTIWCYLNYIRHMMDLPMCEYEDIWKFYEERRKDFEESRKHLQEDNEEGDF